MASWKENKVVGIVAGVVLVIAVIFIAVYCLKTFGPKGEKFINPPKRISSLR